MNRNCNDEMNVEIEKDCVHSPATSKKRRARHDARRENILAHLDSNTSTFLMTLFTLYALFSDDLRILTVDAAGDIVYTVLSSISFFLFLAEILLQCWCREQYMRLPSMSTLQTTRERGLTWKERMYILRSALAIGSFYFWLDLLATLSLSFEIPWMSSSPSTSSSDGGIENARAGRASRAGARAARVIKVVRMIRLVRLVKLYKYFGDANKQKKQRESAVVAPALIEYDDKKTKKNDDDDVNMPPESRVGTEMSDRTTKKVIVGILVMLIGIPLLQINDVQYKNEFGMQMVFERRQHLSNLVAAAEDEADDVGTTPPQGDRIQGATNDWLFSENFFLQTSKCIYLEYDGFQDEEYTLAPIPPDRADPSRLQGPEKTTVAISVASREDAVPPVVPEVAGGDVTTNEEEPKLQMVAIFDISARAREEAILGILLTTFVIGLLAVGTMTFSRDVNTLVILPIEKMVQLVRDISANPLGKDYSLGPDQIREMDDGMETTLLLRTISKIAGLMRVGFGEAGAEIIGKNLNATQSHDDERSGGIGFMGSGGALRGSETAVNVLGNGTKIRSIFAFCDVRNFTDTTECLQEEVMLFVNRIAHILHSIVVQCDGAANKNIGDAFLLTWKLGLAPAPVPTASAEEGNRLAADKALYSLLKTMVEMIRYEDFICNFSPTALGALYERMPRYKCRIGCGLHVGWAVEGAIGSDKKIDASYISPHVNWSEHLESSTKEYGVAVLMSEPFYDLLSPEAKSHCRQVDRIKKGDDITALYTYDANLDQEFPKPESTFDERKRLHTIRKQTRIQVQLKRGYRRMLVDGGDDENRIPGGFGSQGSFTASSSRGGTKNGALSLAPSSSASSDHTNDILRGGFVSGGGSSSSMGALGEAPDILIKPVTANVWKQDEDMRRLRRHFTDEQRLLWKDGMDAYFTGNWSEARIRFNKVLHLSGGLDGPSRLLLSRIKANDGVAPDDWRGYRIVG
mmetsp:Transcript_7066/g.19725  ORF Transcript_7066/g.19725 Transcript_7066/m.19725 type:complete len:973 (+) Transcript_7066:256-3174(+)